MLDFMLYKNQIVSFLANKSVFFCKNKKPDYFSAEKGSKFKTL